MKSIFSFEDVAMNVGGSGSEPEQVELDLPCVIPKGSTIRRKGSRYVVYGCEFAFDDDELMAIYRTHLDPSEQCNQLHGG